MYTVNKKAFTMIELVFVIVVIGILSAIAIPKFAATRDDAIITKARTTVGSVRSALATEKQKRILKGDFSDFNKTGIGYSSSDKKVFTNILEYPVQTCTGSERSCWVVGGTEAAPTYTFREPGGIDAAFTLVNNRLNCTSHCTNFE